jgi:hypothetical protein
MNEEMSKYRVIFLNKKPMNIMYEGRAGGLKREP